MSKGGWNAILQYFDAPVGECLRFSDLPILDAMQICVWADSAAPTGRAKAVYDVLVQRVAPMASAPFHTCGGPRGVGCMASQEPYCRRILIAMTGSAPVDASLASEMGGWQRHGPGEDTIVPVLPASAKPTTVLGRHDKTNVLFDQGDAAAIADTVLQRAGFGGVGRRLFVSYRRRESEKIADQLFDRLGRAGYEVFLDRFSGTPGRPFPDELAESIVDKGVVLLLESDDVPNSPWTLAEVGFAFLFRLGLLALNLEAAPRVALIGRLDRYSARPGWATSGGQRRLNELGQGDLENVVSFIRARYAQQMMKRRLYLQHLLRWGLRRHRLRPRADGAGMFEVTKKGWPFSYRVALAERAPALADVRRARERTQASDRTVLLGPYPYLAPARRKDFEWLVSNVEVRPMAEGEIIRKCSDMARQKL